MVAKGTAIVQVLTIIMVCGAARMGEALPGYIEPDRVKRALPSVLAKPSTKKLIQEYNNACAAAHVRCPAIDSNFDIPIFYDDQEEEAVLSDAERARAARPDLFQLVYLSDMGLEVSTFDTLAEAKAKLTALRKTVTRERGGIIYRSGKKVDSQLELRFMEEVDFKDFLQRAVEPPRAPLPPLTNDQLKGLIEGELTEELRRRIELMPEVGKLRKEYAKKDKLPVHIRGYPIPALSELATLHPELVVLDR
eukprot:TRINITY_DN8577_c0_g1_i1.p1 TRINITY_DN8577_c0_g1~~TRINITY_DN8577_c0_g1_i1.p1  ORF type:complete len:250 (+),score=48.53 TRINITY_DN8577_c0_g1_i1:67-816(+)